MIELDDWVISDHPDYLDQIRVIGPTVNGRFITLAMDPTDDPGIWRPITGWDSTDLEKAYYWEQSA